MTQLKTTKDLRYEGGTSKGDFHINYLIKESDLRAEAIKWIKERIKFCTYCYLRKKCDEHRFWMERFNITDEELK